MGLAAATKARPGQARQGLGPAPRRREPGRGEYGVRNSTQNRQKWSAREVHTHKQYDACMLLFLLFSSVSQDSIDMSEGMGA